MEKGTSRENLQQTCNGWIVIAVPPAVPLPFKGTINFCWRLTLPQTISAQEQTDHMLTDLPLLLQLVIKSLAMYLHVQRLNLTPAFAWKRHEDPQCTLRLKVLQAHLSQLSNLHCIIEVDIVLAEAQELSCEASADSTALSGTLDCNTTPARRHLAVRMRNWR